MTKLQALLSRFTIWIEQFRIRRQSQNLRRVYIFQQIAWHKNQMISIIKKHKILIDTKVISNCLHCACVLTMIMGIDKKTIILHLPNNDAIVFLLECWEKGGIYKYR